MRVFLGLEPDVGGLEFAVDMAMRDVLEGAFVPPFSDVKAQLLEVGPVSMQGNCSELYMWDMDPLRDQLSEVLTQALIDGLSLQTWVDELEAPSDVVIGCLLAVLEREARVWGQVDDVDRTENRLHDEVFAILRGYRDE